MRIKLILSVFVIGISALFISFRTESVIIKNKGYYKLASSIYISDNSDSTIISGNIFDLKTQEALPNSLFTIKDAKIVCMTDACGHFEIKVKTGTYTFVFFRAGNTELMTRKITVKSKNKYHFIAYLDKYLLY